MNKRIANAIACKDVIIAWYEKNIFEKEELIQALDKKIKALKADIVKRDAQWAEYLSYERIYTCDCEGDLSCRFCGELYNYPHAEYCIANFLPTPPTEAAGE